VFRCSDPYLETYYWYRWYGLWLNAITTPTGNYQHHDDVRGGWVLSRATPIARNATRVSWRWMHDPEHARGIFRTFFEEFRSPTGVYTAECTSTISRRRTFYHSNWGDALLALDAVAPDEAFLLEMYPPPREVRRVVAVHARIAKAPDVRRRRSVRDRAGVHVSISGRGPSRRQLRLERTASC
jgi:hypothetical protein